MFVSCILLHWLGFEYRYTKKSQLCNMYNTNPILKTLPFVNRYVYYVTQLVKYIYIYMWILHNNILFFFVYIFNIPELNVQGISLCIATCDMRNKWLFEKKKIQSLEINLFLANSNAFFYLTPKSMSYSIAFLWGFVHVFIKSESCDITVLKFC